MIRSIKHKGLSEFYLTGRLKGIQAHHAARLRILLTALDAAKEIKDLNVSAGDMSEGSKDTVRYFINIGGKDDFDWMSLKDFLKEVLDLGRDDVFKVDCKETFSFFNTEKEHQEKTTFVF